MNNKSKTFITIITTIVLLGLAVLVWVRQDGKAMIFGSTTSQLVTKTIQSEEDWRRGEFENLEYDSLVGLKVKGISNIIKRSDGAIKVTNSTDNISNQNACFSPDSKYILFTRWQNGYNNGPSELVKINLETLQETVVVYSDDSDNVNVPFGSWIDNKITWASDRGGGAEEIFTANDDGTNIKQVTNHTEEGSYIEPVFNPTNNKEIIFEYAPSEDSAHQLAYVNIETGMVIHLTNNVALDDRLPSWSVDGKKILWQRADLGQDNWHIYIADISTGSNPTLNNIKNISQGGEGEYDTDNSWAYNDKYVLSSADYFNSLVPHIFAIPVAGGQIRQITNYTLEDGAPSYAPTGAWIAFESHKTSDPESPSEIWMITTPNLDN